MGRLVQLPAARLVRLGVMSLGAALLVGLMIVVLALAASGQARSDLLSPAALAAAPASRPTPHTTPTAHATPGKSKGSRPGSGSTSAAPPSWLLQGILILLLVLLGFGLVLVPLALRSAREERENQPIYKPAARRSADEQIARLSLIPPERKEPLSREQMQALRASQQQGADIAPHLTGSLDAAHLVSGMPASLPGAEAEAPPQLPAPRRPGGGQSIESDSEG